MARHLSNLLLLALLWVPFGASADEASVKKAVAVALDGATIDEVRKLPEFDLYEVRIGNNVVYTNEKVTYLFSGNLIDVKTKQNLTKIRQRELSVIQFSDLPLDLAVKNVHGKGTRVIASFEDPNCPYCKQFAKELAKVDDLTVYTFLLPILSPDSETKVRDVWCSADRTKAWNDLMINNKSPAPASCTTPADKVKQLAEKYRVTGTPTVFLSNGQRLPGMVEAPQLEEMLKTVKSK